MSLDHDRLNGWKDIATFLGKGVRTVQRWERDYGLPIHRQGASGDLIFAYRSELEAWVRQGGVSAAAPDTASPGQPPAPDEAAAMPGGAAPPGEGAATGAGIAATDPDDEWSQLLPRRPGASSPHGSPPAPLSARAWFHAVIPLAVVVVLVIGAAALALSAWPVVRAARLGPPARWHATGDTLHVHDPAGQVLWSHQFGFDLEARLQYVPASIEGAAPVVIDDLDGDGQREVIVSGPEPGGLDDKGVYAFNADGTLRFRFEPKHRIRFGDEEFVGPWLRSHTFALRPSEGGPAQLWLVYTHGQWFPSLLVRLGPDGRVLAEYWSDGFIQHVKLVRWRGASWLLVAGTNNEVRSASLALFPMGQVRGSAPSANPRYRCTSCPAGHPTHFVVFPRRCLSLAINGQETVTRAWVDDADRMHLLVEEGSAGPDGLRDTSAWYTLGPDLSVVDASFTDAYHAAHARLERQGVLDHPVDAHGHRVLLPVRRWVRDHYEPVPVAATLAAEVR